MLVGLTISIIVFVVVGSDVLIDQWIAGHAGLGYILGTACLIAGICMALFAIIIAIGVAISSVLSEEPPQQG